MKPSVALFCAQSISAVGAGLNLVGFALFFVIARGFTASEIGLGIGLAGALGFVLSMPLSAPGDRLIPRNYYIALNLISGLTVVALSFVGAFWLFVLLAGLQSGLRQAMNSLLQVIVGDLVDERSRTQMMARIRVIRNVGFSVGAVVAAQILVSDDIRIQQLLVALPGLALIAASPLFFFLPAKPRAATNESKPPFINQLLGEGFPHWRYALLAITNIPLMLSAAMLTMGIPLTLETRTDVPRWTTSVFLIANTALVVLLQTRLSRRSESVTGAARSQLLGALSLVGALVALILSPLGESLQFQFALLACSLVLLTFSEMWNSAAVWKISFTFAPQQRRSQYLGLFGATFALQETFSAPLMGFIVESGNLWIPILVSILIIACVAVQLQLVRWMRHDQSLD